MTISINQVEKIKEDLEKGFTPKQIASKIRENPHRIGALARLLGFSFYSSQRDLFQWFPINENNKRATITLGLKSLKLKIKRYRVKDVDETKKLIVVEYV